MAKKFLIVIAPEGFQEKEYSDTRRILENAGVLVSVASLEKGEPPHQLAKNSTDGDGVTSKTEVMQSSEKGMSNWWGGEAIGARGGKISVDFSASEVSVGDYDGVAFIGGQGMVGLVSEPKFTDLAKKFYEANKIVAAICIAPVILANAGILKGKRATVCGGAENEIKNAGGIYTGKSVEIDGEIITANGPSAAEEFGKTIVKLLTE